MLRRPNLRTILLVLGALILFIVAMQVFLGGDVGGVGGGHGEIEIKDLPPP